MKKLALLVGVEEYQDVRISGLKFVRNDVRALAGCLRDQCEFQRVRVLAEPSGRDAPTLGNVLDSLTDMAGELREDDTFLLYFAGHGVEVNGKGFLLMPDARHAFPDVGSLPLERLKEAMAKFAARRRILLLDACRNDPQAARGDADNMMGEVISRDIVAAAKSREESGGSSTSLLSACRTQQRAYAWPEKKHGVFTYYLLQGLRGAAWKDDRVTFQELAGYVQTEVARWSKHMPGIDKPQEPWYEHYGAPSPVVLGRQVIAEVVSDRPSVVVPAAEIAAKELDLGGEVRIELVSIPAGEFMMGSPAGEADRDGDEGPAHKVRLPDSFYLSACPVTQAQYEWVMGDNPSEIPDPDHPVETVSWEEALAFCRELSTRTGSTVRLPTEAEWEYACRAGCGGRFGFGDQDAALGDYAWYDANSQDTTHPVGRKKPNDWGLYDMHGNVFEWCGDAYDAAFYAESEDVDPTGPPVGDDPQQVRVLRGGAWCSLPAICRSAFRYSGRGNHRFRYAGFRVAVDLK